MNKSIILLAAAVFLCSGCEKLSNKIAINKGAPDQKTADAQAAAAKAADKVAARIAAGAAAKAADNSKTTGTGQAGEALVAILCSSPKLMEGIESNMDLLEALSGEGGDPGEVKRQLLELQKHYRTIMETALPAHGATTAEFSRYAMKMMPSQATAEQKQKFKALITEKCPRGNKALVEKTAGGLMRFCMATVP